MTNYKKILVPIDPTNKSHKIIDEAISIAKHYGSTIIVLYVLPFSPLSFRDIRIAQEVMFKEAKTSLEKITVYATKKEVMVKTKILKGHPGELVSNFANTRSNGIDLVVIGSRDLKGVKKVFLGSVSNYVVHNSKVSVLVVK